MRALNITSDLSEYEVIIKNGIECDMTHYGAIANDVVKCSKVQHSGV